MFLFDAFKRADANWWSRVANDGRFREAIGDAGAAADARPDAALQLALHQVPSLKSTSRAARNPSTRAE